jgi:hypothetical protein
LGVLVLALSMAPAVGKSPPARAIIEPVHIVEAIKLQQAADAAKDQPPKAASRGLRCGRGRSPSS